MVSALPNINIQLGFLSSLILAVNCHAGAAAKALRHLVGTRLSIESPRKFVCTSTP